LLIVQIHTKLHVTLKGFRLGYDSQKCNSHMIYYLLLSASKRQVDGDSVAICHVWYQMWWWNAGR